MRLFFFLLLFLSACNYPTVNTQSPPVQNSTDSVETETVVALDTSLAVKFDYDTMLWRDISHLDPDIQVDMKYATTDNFVKEKMYDCSRCFLRPEVARTVVEINRQLKKKGYGLKMLDCFRPRPIQWKLWKKVPNPRYVADPRKGSMHNRGVAVDLTLVDALGKELDMGTPFDFFGPEAHPSYTNLPDSILDRRKLLSTTMLENGFKPIKSEWWHFSWQEKSYPLSDMLWACD